MGARVDGVDLGARVSEHGGQLPVDFGEVVQRHQTSSDASLVRHHHDQSPSRPKARDRVGGAIQEDELIRASNVIALGRLAVDRPVAVEEHRPAMVTLSRRHQSANSSRSTNSQRAWPISMWAS